MGTQGQQPTSWKEKAIQKAEGISDAWEVVKEYLGRATEWVLFACMLENIIQMLPGINLPEMLTNAVMGTQVIMLDIGGFALASMAERAREQGHEEAADKAATTVKFLIGLMILTLLFVAVGNLFPAYKSSTDMAEKFLILVRVVMTVVYGHVIHGMRKFSHMPNQHQAQPASYDLDAMKAAIIHEVTGILQSQGHDYPQLAKAIAPYLAPQVEATITREIEATVTRKIKATITGPMAPQIEAGATKQLAARASSKKEVDEASVGGSQEERLEATYQAMLAEGQSISGRALAKAAHINRDFATAWLKAKREPEARATYQGHQDTEAIEAIIVDSEPASNFR